MKDRAKENFYFLSKSFQSAIGTGQELSITFIEIVKNLK